MSGTSLDGIDIVIAKIDGVFKDTSLEVIQYENITYDPLLRQKIIDSMDNALCNAKLICSLNYELSYAYASAVKQVCSKHDVKLSDVDFIACHGQTIYHINEDSFNVIQSSLQLGDGSVLANLCQTTVVSNFRSADIAAGGTGAPLVPYADYILFHRDDVSASYHNIGGISNLTFIPAGKSIEDIIAFDTGPGNMMIDYLSNELFGLPFDEKGKLARQGKLHEPLLKELMSHPFFKKNPPKSTGREEFGIDFSSSILKKYKYLDSSDLICTFTHFTAKSMAKAYEDFIFPKYKVDEIYLSGGGAKNQFLFELIQTYLPKVKIKQISETGLNESAKEALAFIILGNETLGNLPSNVKSVTGASRNVILGQVSYFYQPHVSNIEE